MTPSSRMVLRWKLGYDLSVSWSPRYRLLVILLVEAAAGLPVALFRSPIQIPYWDSEVAVLLSLRRVAATGPYAAH